MRGRRWRSEYEQQGAHQTAANVENRVHVLHQPET